VGVTSANQHQAFTHHVPLFRKGLQFEGGAQQIPRQEAQKDVVFGDFIALKADQPCLHLRAAGGHYTSPFRKNYGWRKKYG